MPNSWWWTVSSLGRLDQLVEQCQIVYDDEVAAAERTYNPRTDALLLARAHLVEAARWMKVYERERSGGRLAAPPKQPAEKSAEPDGQREFWAPPDDEIGYEGER